MRKMKLERLAAVTLVFGLAACDSLVDVENPNVVEAESIDPQADAPTFARSALQNFYSAWGAGSGGNEPLILSGAWFTNEARVGDTFPTRNEYGRRILSDANGTLNGASWTPIARAVSTNFQVIDLLRGTAGEDNNINVARANFGAGYSLIYMAESFCQSVINVQAPMDMPQAMDSAIARFQRAIAVGTANGTAEGTALANASRVGLARAYLNKGDLANARTAAGQVPAGFVFNVTFVDDPANRARLGNGLFGFSAGGGRESLVVGPEWRAHADAGDTRVSYQDTGRDAQDGILRMYTQRKFGGYGAAIRLASKLEADYIAAEAGTVAEQLALIAARRTAAGLAPYAGAVDAASVLQELLLQKHLDFWLEGQRMGDFRRNPTAVSYIIPPGDNYYKPQVGEVSNQTCWPVPVAEKSNNPNF